MIRIGLIDDHDLYRVSLKSYLSSKQNYTVMLEASSADDFFKELAKVHELPDIIITDFKMPNKNGQNVIEIIKNDYPLIKIIVMSVYTHDHLIAELFESGTDGFITKGVKPTDLFKSMELILNGRKILITNDSRFTILSSTFKKQLSPFKKVKLSSRQLEFLHFCVNTELTYKEIAEQLYISPKTADRYRDDLFKKLNVKSRSGLLLYAIQRGLYIF